MRQFFILLSLMLSAAAFTQAQTPANPSPARLLPIVEEISEEVDGTSMYWEPEYELDAWVATIKTHYATVQSMASKPEPVQAPLDPNLHSPMVLGNKSTH